MRDYGIVFYPDPILDKKAREITEEELRTGTADGHSLHYLVSEMTRIMRDKDRGGAGLAAPQIGVGLRLFIVDATQRRTDPLVFINPILSELSDATETDKEGCLSIPEVVLAVKRHKKLVVTAKRLDGTEIKLNLSDMLARIVQHENDHLDGILITRYASIVSRPLIAKKLDRLINISEATKASRQKFEKWRIERKKKESLTIS